MLTGIRTLVRHPFMLMHEAGIVDAFSNDGIRLEECGQTISRKAKELF
jgi:hypothetical protein